MPSRIPSLCRKKQFAVVTLTDALLHRRKTFYCGQWDTPEAKQKYAGIICQWHLAGGRWPGEPVEGITITEIVDRYWAWAEGYYSSGERGAIRQAWQILVAHCGTLAAEKFGPIKLREVRQRMIDAGWSRTNINSQVHRVAAIFKWAASNELLPITVYQALKTIMPLKRGRCEAPESEPVRPVAQTHVDATLRWVSKPVAAVIRLQRLTGARPGEILKLRKGDIDRSDGVWQTNLADHKTAHHGHARVIYFGPQAQAVLSPWLMRPDDAYLFRPVEAEEDRIWLASEGRKTPLNCGNVAKGRRRKDLGEHYTSDSYRRAIERGCDAADRWAKGGRVCGDDERLVPRWHPHQLRHTADTEIRKRFGLEAAQLVLGHSSALVTDAIYAERDAGKVMAVVAEWG